MPIERYKKEKIIQWPSCITLGSFLLMQRTWLWKWLAYVQKTERDIHFVALWILLRDTAIRLVHSSFLHCWVSTILNSIILIHSFTLPGLWWIILLRAYGKITGDYALQERVDVQTGIKLVLNLCLSDGFDMFPSLLVTDGSCMVDRRMGIHGHPLEIQVSWVLV